MSVNLETYSRLYKACEKMTNALPQLESEINERNTYIDQQNRRLVQFKDQVDKKNVEITKLNASVAHKSTISKELVSTKVDLINCKTNNEKLERQVNELSNSLAHMFLTRNSDLGNNALAKELLMAKAEITKCKAEIASLSKTKRPPTDVQKSKELNIAKKEIKELNEKNQHLAENLQRTKTIVASLNKAVKNKNALNGEIKATKSQVTKLTQRANILKNTIKENKKELADKNAIIEVLGGDGHIENADAARPACSICTSAFQQNDSIVATRCGHIYHNACLQPWLNTSRTCPKCRKPSTTGELLKIYLDIYD